MALRQSRPLPSHRFASDLRHRLSDLEARAHRPRNLWLLVGACACAGVLLLLVSAARASAGTALPSTFTTGFSDPVYVTASNPNPWLSRTVAAGARLVLVGVSWPSVSPAPPRRGTDPSSPSNPGYHWGELDRAVRAATAHGLTVVLAIASGGGPAWVDGPHRPRSIPPGTWYPSTTAFGDFARAVARRYSGSFRPAAGATPLPRVSYYQGWGEPNLNDHLNPQWIRVRGRWVAESPAIYRRLLNAFYSAVKSVHSSNLVITAGTAPFGDPPGGGRIPPALFVRDLLCLNTALKPLPCADPAHFDILAHHPYDFGGPYQKAYNRDDVSLPDLAKLTGPLHVAERDGRALPRGPKPVWVTEFSWDSSPPDPHGVPLVKRADWIAEMFHELWREGVSAIAWYLIRDQPPVPSYASSYQSGLFYVDGRRKAGFEAFRFPFLVVRSGRGKHRLWGLAPTGGTLRVQESVHGRWQTLFTLGVRAHGVFTRPVTLSGHPLLRATIGHEASLGWRVR